MKSLYTKLIGYGYVLYVQETKLSIIPRNDGDWGKITCKYSGKKLMFQVIML